MEWTVVILRGDDLLPIKRTNVDLSSAMQRVSSLVKLHGGGNVSVDGDTHTVTLDAKDYYKS